MSDYLRFKLIQQARTRVWAIILLHLLCSPVASAIYSGKQNNWLAFGAGTGVFVIGLPFMIFDLGITAFILAPVASILILANKSTEARRQLGIHGPEMADQMMYEGHGTAAPKAATVTGNVTFTATEGA